MKIYLDFDNTVVEQLYPKIGKYNHDCFKIIRKLQEAGHEIILNTYRVQCYNGTLEAAIDFLNNEHIKPITKITPKKHIPTPWNWEYMLRNQEIFIDDITENIPLKPTTEIKEMMVDWNELDKQFLEFKIY